MAITELLPWQRPQWSGLIERFRSGTLPHALLLTGAPGLGKLRFAGQLAQAMLCEQPSEDGQACGGCRACQLFESDTHPDHFQLVPEEDSKVIKIGQIRALIASLGMKSQMGGYRVVVIAPAERMNTEAANSLLKTLEEPGEQTALILVSAQAGFLPATVRSRCQKVPFPRPPQAVAEDWLRTRTQAGEPALLLSLAQGAPLAALELAQGEGLSRRAALTDDLLALASRRGDPIAMAERWHKEDLAECVGWLTGLVMDMIRLKSAVRPPTLSNPDCRESLQPIAERLDLRVLYAHLDRLRQAARLANTQVSTQSVLEDVLIPLRMVDCGR